MLHVRLTKLSVEGLAALLKEIEELETAFERLSQALEENAISGRVLMHCDLNELKSLLGLSFGHWEIFRLLVNCLRDIEKLQPTIKLTEVDSVQPVFPRQKSVIEKQVSYLNDGQASSLLGHEIKIGQASSFVLSIKYEASSLSCL